MDGADQVAVGCGDVRRMASVMEPGSAIVVTASLAGLVAMDRDPLYTLTKHGVIGFVRSVAPQLEARGIRISAIAPGFADTPLLDDASREAMTAARFPLLSAEEVAAAAVGAAREAAPGAVWVVQPGREPAAGLRGAGARGALRAGGRRARARGR